jgi:hypothetical protein
LWLKDHLAGREEALKPADWHEEILKEREEAWGPEKPPLPTGGKPKAE